MTIVNQDKLLLGVSLALVLLISGCAEAPPRKNAATRAGFPDGLEQLQGTWCLHADHPGSATRIRFDGYHIQLAYTDSTNNVRRNASIQDIDPDQCQLRIHGDKVPWRYFIEEETGGKQLVLNFRDKDRNRWVSLKATKQQEQQVPAG